MYKYILLALVVVLIPEMAQAKDRDKDKHRRKEARERHERFEKHHPRRAQVNERERHQDRWINSDVRNGKLTRAQGKQLRADEAKIKAQERAEVRKNGGHLTKKQQQQLNQEMNAERNKIRSDESANVSAAGVR